MFLSSVVETKSNNKHIRHNLEKTEKIYKIVHTDTSVIHIIFVYLFNIPNQKSYCLHMK